jgi:hypothetical protein
MSSTAGTVLLLIVVVALLAAAFIGLWIRDKGRADEESADPARVAPDPSAETRSDSWAKTPPNQDGPGSPTG